MSSHDPGESLSEKDTAARLPLPISPGQNVRVSPGPLAPMSCRSCRQRKSKCSRKIPTCETCERHGFQCVYDAVPKKRVPNAHLVKELLHRVHTLERQNQQDVVIQNTASQQATSSPKSAASSEAAATPSNPEPDLNARREMLGVFFTHIHGNPYIFVHEGSIRRNVMNSRASTKFLFALFALSTCYLDHTDQSIAARQAERYLGLSEIPAEEMDFSIETIQIIIMQVLCCKCLGKGTQAWIKLGIAIRMAQGMELHMEPKSSDSSEAKALARLCVHTLYAMDRFSVCGTNRPMIFSDDSIWGLKLPSIDGVDVDQSIRISEPWQFDGGQSQQMIILQMFTSITVLLGRCNKYLQNGGVQGDSHFPWHPRSNLAGLVKELEKWYSKAQLEMRPDDIDCSQTAVVDRYYLSWLMYHTIFIRLYRQFLPLISASTMPNSYLEPWQQETSRKCVDHAVKIFELCTKAHQQGYSWPFFSSFCIGSACTVFIHAAHYDSGENHLSHLVFLIQKLLSMRGRYALVDYQCNMLRKMHIIHADMVRKYRSQTLVTANLHLTQFYKRYPEGQFDSSHIPLTRLGSWMDPSLDGADDIFAMESLQQQLGSLRGIPYTYQGKNCYESQQSQQFTIASSSNQSLFTDEGLSASLGMYQSSSINSLDGYFEFEEPSVPQDLSGILDAEMTQSIGQDLIDSLLQQVSEDEFRDLEF